MEKWKYIDGYRRGYIISDRGRVYSLKSGKLIKAAKSSKGYLLVNLSFNGKATNHYIHRLVASAFTANPLSKKTVNHKNGIKTDNRIENLEWATRSENHKHSYDYLGRQAAKGEDHGNAKLKEEQVVEIRDLASKGYSHKSIGEKFNICRQSVGLIASRKRWGWIP